MGKYVFNFKFGSKELKDILGGKGANLAEMTKIGLPIPPGFTITTKGYQHYIENHQVMTQQLDEEIIENIRE